MKIEKDEKKIKKTAFKTDRRRERQKSINRNETDQLTH